MNVLEQIGKKAHADQKMGARKRYELKLSQERGDDDDNESAPSRAKNFAGW
jgi:phage protein U